MGRNVVIGAGPAAHAVVAALEARGDTAVVVTRSGTVIAGSTSMRADVSDPVQAARAINGADVVYQCAQPEYHRWPQEFGPLQRSIVGAAKAAEAALVVADNLYGYGPHDGPMVESLPLRATTRKGRVRAEMWHELASANSAGDLRVVAARASDFYGPGVEGSVLGERYFEPLLAGGRAEVLGRADALHSYTFVSDFGEAMVRLAGCPDAWGRAWHIPNAPAITNRKFLELAAQAAVVVPRSVRRGPMQLRLAGLFIPAVRETVEMMYEFTQDFVVDHAAYAAVLGDHSTPTEEGLARTIDWYRSRARATIR